MTCFTIPEICEPEVLCGFLAVCRKDFTVGVQATFRGCLLKLGTESKEGPRIEEATGEGLTRGEMSVGWAALSQ